MSTAMTAHSEAIPKSVRITNKALIDSENQMFWRMTESVFRECSINQGSFIKSSDICAMTAVAIAASLPAAPKAKPNEALPDAIRGYFRSQTSQGVDRDGSYGCSSMAS